MSEEEKIPHEDSRSLPDTHGNPNGKEQEAKEESRESNQPLASSQQLETISQSQLEPQLSNMEVHKHPHHVADKKKWSEYALEFLMIFLAVFLGFLAENFRENLVERRREKQFINSLVNDLNEDARWFDVVKRSSEQRIYYFNSAISLFSTSKNDEIPSTIYNALQKSMIQVVFLPFNGTITQLKSSGELRIITSKQVVDTLEDYDRQLRRLELRRNYTEQLTHDFKEALNKTVIGSDLLVELKDSIVYGKKTSTNPPIKLNGQNLDELINEIVSLRSRVVFDTTVNGTVRRQAIRLVELIRKEYHLHE